MYYTAAEYLSLCACITDEFPRKLNCLLTAAVILIFLGLLQYSICLELVISLKINSAAEARSEESLETYSSTVTAESHGTALHVLLLRFICTRLK